MKIFANTRTRSMTTVLVAVLLLLAGSIQPLAAQRTTKRPKVQVAFLLDTSSSMDGLINQARAHLWDIVNTIATGKRHGVIPDIEVALYEYGNSRLSSRSGYIRQVVPFSNDLDTVSEALFDLATNGGDEYCGRVLKEAESLQWAEGPGVYRSIFIAGNESFEQGSVPYQNVAATLKARGIIVNTIFCGAYQDGIRQQWMAGAQAGGGQYTVIEQDKAAIQVAAPQDKRLLELNQQLNNTYMALGARAKKAKERQEKQDDAAASMGRSSKVARTVAKASAPYQSADWDVVGQLESGDAEPLIQVLADEVKDLPEEEQAQKTEALRKEAETKLAQRRQIKKEIAELNQKRKAYLAKHAKSQGTINEAMRTSIRTQMRGVGYSFK